MNIEKIQNLINSGNDENIQLAIGIIINQVTKHNVFSTAAMLQSIYSTNVNSSNLVRSNEELSNALKDKLTSFNQECHYIYKKSVAEIFSAALMNINNEEDLLLTKEYYIKYIDHLTNSRVKLLLHNKN